MLHVFYTLFSKDRLGEVKVYGRLSKRKQIKLSKPTFTYDELRTKHLVNAFPLICAWRLTEYLHPHTIEFHIDSYEGHICEAQEELEQRNFNFFVYSSGDCSNPVISTADLLIGLIDNRLSSQNKYLLFQEIQSMLPEFGGKLRIYPIKNKHLPKITPLDSIEINTLAHLKHPVFWVFKGDEMINSSVMKHSRTYRNLVDYVASQAGTVKMFNSSKDADYINEGDYGVYIGSRGKDIINTYRKIGKRLKPYDMNTMVANQDK